MGVGGLFECVVLSGEIGISKPDVGIFLRGCALLNAAPAECLYVGDSFESDMVGARDAGMRTCWYRPQGKPGWPLPFTPDHVIRELRELCHLL